MFRPDLPITSAGEDLLGRASFSAALADAIMSYDNEKSVVTALYGAWGSGKSSVVNMVLERLSNATSSMNSDERPIVIKFNPWNYSDQNQLVGQFFRSISVALKRGDPSGEAKKAGEQLETYSEFFKPLALIPEPTGLMMGLATAASVVFKTAGVAATGWAKLKSKDLEQIRSDLDALLIKQKRKIVIVVDDIDRLNSIEIRQIFQLVKALGDFPYTVYFLAFDRNLVVQALAKVQEGLGNDYLEKIVQIPFQLPSISKGEVEKVLFSQLDELIKDTQEARWDSTHWGNVYQGGLRYFFITIRDVTRYINSLRFAFGMVRDEVNPVDFLAVTALQVFEPLVYEGIRDNPDLFTGVLETDYGGRESIKKQAQSRCDEIMGRAAALSRSQLLELLTRLFPKVESTYENMGYGAEFLSSWRQQARVCSPDKFEIFFRLSVPAGDFSEREISVTLNLAKDQAEFSRALVSFSDAGRIIRFLERLEDFTREGIPLQNIQTIVNVLMDIGDLFPEGSGGAFERDTSMKVMRLFYQLSQRYSTHDERFTLFQTAIAGARQSIHTLVREVGLHGQQHGKLRANKEVADPEEKRSVRPEQLKQLEQLAVSKIEEWATDGRLRGHRNLVSILYMWKEWGNDGDRRVREFVNEMIKDDDGLLAFVAALEGKAFVHGFSDHVGRIEYRINLKTVDDFVEVRTIEPRIRALAQSQTFRSLSAERQRAVTTFLETVDGKRKDW